jgi:hypothetical protein
VPPTATFTPLPTNTPLPPTATFTPLPTNTPIPPTNTPLPPTATFTPLPTNTPIPPTNTPLPPTATPTAAASLPSAYWALDDGSGTTALDSSGNNHHGTLVNGPLWTTGQVNGGLQLDGVNDFVDTAYTATVSTVSFIAWVYPDPGGDKWARLIQKSGEFEFILEETGNKIVFGQRFSSSWGYWSTANNVVPDGSWTHLAVTYDRSSPANDPAVYLNGSLVSLTEITAPAGAPVYNPNRYSLGALSNGRRSLAGRLDEVKVFETILSPAEILNDFTTTMALTPNSVPLSQSADASRAISSRPRAASIPWRP